VIFSLWIVLTVDAAPRFQELVGSDSFAMINVLFPYFWVILLGFLGVCFFCFLRSDTPVWLNMMLVGQLSLVLYLTPFLLSGFSWSPDSLWHGGIARYLPEIFSGQRIAYGHYAQSYPFSFLPTFLFTQVFGVGLVSYSTYIYPVISSLLISQLGYVFVSRVFNHKVAFLSLLLTLPALHYFEPHVSPFSTGTILVLVSFILLTFRNRFSLILSFSTVVLLTLTHPISPMSLGVYILSYIVVGFVFRFQNGTSKFFSRSFLLSFLFFLGIVWFSWTIFYAMTIYYGLESALFNFFNFGFFASLLEVSSFTVGAQSFIVPEIHQISLLIYGIFLIFSIMPMLEYSLRALGRFNPESTSFSLFDKMGLSFTAIVSAAMGFFLFLSSGERFLLGRGLLYFIFMASMVVATYFVSRGKFSGNLKKIVAFGLIIFLFFSFPVLSYSKEAYNSFTPSADSGLRFLTSNVELNNKTISMGVDQQLAGYADLTQTIIPVNFPPNLNFSLSDVNIDENATLEEILETVKKLSPDIVVMSINSYYVISMRYDLNYTDNSYLDLQNDLETNILYNNVYSNPRFETYVRPSILVDGT
jgi:hypothetical protein